MGLRDTFKRWSTTASENGYTRPKPTGPSYLRAAQAAWDRGDATYIYLHRSDWSTGSWKSSTASMNRQVAAIAAIGWMLTSGSRQPLHGSILFTFVRPT
jgi:hypothetical protein